MLPTRMKHYVHLVNYAEYGLYDFTIEHSMFC